ncbi:DUF4249 domain-containing protein [Carboxylicivirga mesophila]|uniref:DUF4249 domain-containing protein n=1 Tax=Carboxylicivirga mesophila TaxID=1166478 RepID=A0ABS5K5X7_9BACT|nr:DUF4249 domain-containing protein [Carboxylicivirga mesophila]MBS2210352.1 DUF4249 domain-containing protein [Carboxylicivirga mesophila]
MRAIYILLATAFLMSSCEKEIAYKGKELENFMVVNSVLLPDSLLSCRVTRSNTIFDDETIKVIGDATVEVYQDKELVEVLPYSPDGYYRSASLKAVEGQNYSFNISHESYETISGQTKVPTRADAIIQSAAYNENTYMYDVTLAITDLPGDDYYRLLAYVDDVIYDYDGNVIQEGYVKAFINSSDPVLNFNKVSGDESDFSDYPDNNYMVFDDALFDGETYQLRVGISYYAYGARPMRIILQHLNEDLFLYYSSVQSHIYYDEDPFAEPVQIHSNVSNGAGIWSSAAETLMEVGEENR